MVLAGGGLKHCGAYGVTDDLAKKPVENPVPLVRFEIGGMTGALVGQGIAGITVYPFLMRLARRHGAWDPLHDGIFFSVGYLLGAVALWLHHDKIALLAQLVAP